MDAEAFAETIARETEGFPKCGQCPEGTLIPPMWAADHAAWHARDEQSPEQNPGV